MVRRRRSTKAEGGSSSSRKARPVDRKDASVKKWEKLTDIPMEDEDEFHSAKDHILLDNDRDNADDLGDEDEVFALKGMPADQDSDSEVEVEPDSDEDVEMVSPKLATKKAAKKKKKGKKAMSSESEQDSSEDEHWGQSKATYYSSNANQLESDDEEGNELELQEARRIQGKLIDDFADNDFGFGTIEDQTQQDAMEPASLELAVPTEKSAIIRYLQKTNPEALALARDWDEVANNLIKLRSKIETVEAEDFDPMSLDMLHLHYQTLLTYATTLAFYFHMRSTPKYTRKPDLLNTHPIFSRLLTLKQSLSTLEQLNLASSDDELDEFDDEFDESDESQDEDLDAQMLWSKDKKKGLHSDELAQLLKEASASTSRLLEDDQTEQAPRPKKKRKTAKDEQLPIFDVQEPDFSTLPSSSKSQSPHSSSSIDAFGESTSLSHGDAADKAARKKSLRFYTAKLDSAASKRVAARAALGGDDDIPYKDRKKAKELREARELAQRSEKGGLGLGGADLDDEEPEMPMKVGRDDEEEDDDYYGMVQKEAKERKTRKKEKYNEAVETAKEAHYSLSANSPGPRALTRAILSNKGLTPRRPKTVRNPRVKKRLSYEKANRKVGSQKAVYKGGLKDTGGKYEGEKTGITKVAKGIKLS